MKHRIGKRADVAKALVRLLRLDIRAAAAELRAPGPREERVHRVRQRLKRVRTILRVLEPAFGERALTLRQTLAEAARLLARARDADVAAASARQLAATTTPADDAGFDRVAASLDAEAARVHQERTPLGDVSRRFAEAIAEAATFEPDFDGQALLAAGLRRAYARGRTAMLKAENSLSTPDLHRWRKTVKDLWHLIRLARKRLPKRLVRTGPNLERLGDALGLGNDHALLAEKLALSPTGDPALMRQLALIARRRNALEAEAFALGARLYSRKPKAFAGRLHLHRHKPAQES
ncbi:MAG TPA: CHAD domain-containing protein [Bauldia sp.]